MQNLYSPSIAQKDRVQKDHVKMVNELAGSLKPKVKVKWNKKKAFEAVGKMLAEHINEQTHR